MPALEEGPSGGLEGDASALVRVDRFGELASPSSLLSSRWSRDNLVTSHPGRLYDGRVVERIEPDALEYLVQELASKRGPMRVGEGRMGVFTWDFVCEDEKGALVVQFPIALDAPGRRGRAKRDVPRLNVENAEYFIARGLTRFVAEPMSYSVLTGGVPVATFRAFDGYFPLSFGSGAIDVRLPDGWFVALGPTATAEILAEMIAALVYHYEPETEGGTALTDVFVNDGDFAVKRRTDGSFELRLTAARRREANISSNLLLLYLVQMMAYQDFAVNGALTGLPTLISNPSVTFEGVVRGLRYRYRDLGGSEEEATREARRWIFDFGRSPEGRAYRAWVERFLEGHLPLRFGDDLRERWWRLFPEQTKRSLLELRARSEGASGAADSARNLKTFLDRLSREIGRIPDETPGTLRINDLGRSELLSVLERANVDAAVRDAVADDIISHWPYRSLDQLLARVPRARGLRRLKSQLSFGHAFSDAEQGTLKELGPTPKSKKTRPLANSELFCARDIAPALAAAAARTFLTFEAYMDAALHDPTWGYYAKRVVIGGGGHFDTHPEELSPRYGGWLASYAFEAWQDMVSHGELSPDESFALLEFGAGNGRLARDVLDAVARAASDDETPESKSWRRFRSCLRYCIYERSESLREKQRSLLGDLAVVAPGDARCPAATLARDFPDGVKGVVVTNEVPDAFGVHKVVMTAEGRAFATLVLPRIEQTLRDVLSAQLSERVGVADAAIRREFGFQSNPGDHYLDAPTFGEVMQAIALSSAEEREARLAHLWFEEAYVPVSTLPALDAHLAEGAAEYSAALSGEGSGVVLYVNVHASDFIRELGSSLRAGFIVTIDYGDSTSGLVQGARRGDFPFRVYGEWQDYVPRPNDPYSAPGTQDLTADVNFTDLARAGRACGLHVIHYGPERDIVGKTLPEVLRRADEDGLLARFLGNFPFKVLVLGTRPSNAFSSPLMTPLRLSLLES